MGNEHGELAVEVKILPHIDPKGPRVAEPAAPRGAARSERRCGGPMRCPASGDNPLSVKP
jgi:hypothetical protein